MRGTLEKRFTVARLLIVFWYMKGKPQYILFCCVSGPCTIKTISLLKDENLGSIQKSCLYMISWTLHENIWTLFNFYLFIFSSMLEYSMSILIFVRVVPWHGDELFSLFEPPLFKQSLSENDLRARNTLADGFTSFWKSGFVIQTIDSFIALNVYAICYTFKIVCMSETT